MYANPLSSFASLVYLPVEQQPFEVLEQCVTVLVNEGQHGVRHVPGVVAHTEVPVVFQGLVGWVQL